MTPQTKTVTAEKLLEMPDDGMRRELVRGELREMAPAGEEHGYLAGEILGELRSHVKANGLGRTYAAEIGFKISSDPDTVRAPDAAFVSRERVEAAGRITGFRPGAPDLVIEADSPNARHSDVLEKALGWLQAGCRMVLVVNPGRRTITVYRSRDNIRILTADAGDVVDGADVVPGWKLSLAEVFAQE